MASFDYHVADVFTETALEGNPVAVFLDAKGLTTDRMQSIAREMHLSETVFVMPPTNDGDVRVRIFTPVNELPFAGHPTLGAAIILAEFHRSDRILIETDMGTIPFALTRAENGHPLSAEMQQPVPSWQTYELEHELLGALGLDHSTLPILIYTNGPRHVFVGLESEAALSALTPDHRILARLPDVAINCFAGSGTHWRMRMFSPAYGVVEDAATGSAAGPLAIHLANHGLVPFGSEIEILQGVEIFRPSLMKARVSRGNAGIERVDVSGSAVVVMKGVLHV